MENELNQKTSSESIAISKEPPLQRNEEGYRSSLKELFEKVKLFTNGPRKNDQGDMNKLVEEFLHFALDIPREIYHKVLQDSLLEIMKEISNHLISLEALLYSENLMGFILKKLTLEPYTPIFMVLIDAIQRNPGKGYPELLFSKVKKFFELIHTNHTEEIKEDFNLNNFEDTKFAHYNSFLLICHLMVKLLISEDENRSLDNLKDLSSICKMQSSTYQHLLFSKKSDFYKSHFGSSCILEEILKCLEVKKQAFQTRELASCLLILTYCIFQGNVDLLKFFSQHQYQQKLYLTLSHLNEAHPFSEQEIIFILNLLLNMATNDEFFYIFQKMSEVDGIFSPDQVLKDLKNNPEARALHYVSLISEDVLYVILKILFEWANISEEIKLCYLKILSRMLKHSLYNALSCGQASIINYLFICFRKEKSEKVKKTLSTTLNHILYRNTSITQFKGLIRIIQYKVNELYPQFFQSVVNSPAVQKAFIEGMLDLKSYYMSLKIIFQKIIPKILSQKENPENFIHFNGQKSGILVQDLSLKSLHKTSLLSSSKREFSIFIEFRAENLQNSDKENLFMGENSIKRVSLPARSLIQDTNYDVAINGNFHIKDDYFLSSMKSSSIKSIKAPSRASLKESIIESYNPRLFSLSSKKEPVSLDLYIGNHGNKKVLYLEGMNPKKGAFQEIFDVEIRENQWYTVLLTYSTKNKANLYFNGQVARRINQKDLSPVLEAIDTFQTLIIGASSSASPHNITFNPKTSFQGQIRNFLILPFEEVPQGGNSITALPNQLSYNRMSITSNQNEVPIKKKKDRMGAEELFDCSLLNLNAFIRLSKLNVHEEILWISNAGPSVIYQGQRKSSLKKKESEAQNDSQKVKISSKGVFYMETFNFEDTLFSVGGLEGFIYCIELLTNFEGFENLQLTVDILCEILNTISILTNNAYKEDSLAFLLDNGVYELSYLVQKFVSKHGASLELAKGVIRFLETFPDNLAKYKGAYAFFWKFVVWEACSDDLQTQIFVESLQLLNEDMKKDYFKKNCNAIWMLFYLHQKIHCPRNVESASCIKSKTEEEKLEEDKRFESVSRPNLLREIISKIFYFISYFIDHEIAKTEYLFLSQYLATCSLDIHLYEALSKFIELFKYCSTEAPLRYISIKNLLSVLYEIEFPNLLASLLLRCFDDPLIDQVNSSPANPFKLPESPHVVDKIAAAIIEIIDLVVFRPLEKVGDSNGETNVLSSAKLNKHSSLNLPNPATKANSSTTKTAPTKAKTYLEEAQQYKIIFLKLLNRCCGEKVGERCFQSLMSLAKPKDDDSEDVLNNDKQILSLLLTKSLSWKEEIQTLFLNQLIRLFKIQKNFKILMDAPKFNEFLHYCITNERPEDHQNITGDHSLKNKFIRICLLYLFKSADGFFRIITLSCLKSNDCFGKIIKSHLIDILRTAKQILSQSDPEEDSFPSLDVNSKEFYTNLIQFISYLATWVSEIGTPERNLIVYENEVQELLELLIPILLKLELIYTTLPDFRLDGNRIKAPQVASKAEEIANKMEEVPLYRNGGVFFTIIRLLFDTLTITNDEDRKCRLLKLASTLMSASEGSLIEKMQYSNENLANFLKKYNSQGYFDSASQENSLSCRPQETVVYGYTLHICVQYLMETIQEHNQNIIVDPSKNIPPHITDLLVLIEKIVVQGGSYLAALVTEFMIQHPGLDEENREEGRKNEFENIESQKASFIDLEQPKKQDLKQRISRFLVNLNMFETHKKINKSLYSQQSNKQSDQRSFFLDLLEFCRSKKDEKVPKLYDFLIVKNLKHVKEWLLPNLKDNCRLVLDTIHDLSKSYYNLYKMRVIESDNNPINDRDLDWQGIFSETLKTALKMVECFEKEFNVWEKREKRNLARIKKKWNFQKTNLVQDRGIWQVEDTSNGLVRYKIDKAEDSIRRRLRLKRDQHAANKEYLSVAAYQERLKMMQSDLTLAIKLPKSGRLSTQPRVNDRQSLEESILEEGSLVNQESDQFTFSQIPKEEVLSDIKEGALEPPKKKLIDNWKKPCEKIVLKGAVYGNLEIREGRYVAFTPSEEERSDEEPYCFGALKNSFLKNYKKTKQWKVSSISEVHARNYNLRSTAVEVFIRDDGKTYFFNLYTKEAQQEFIEYVAGLNPQVVAITDRVKDFKRLDYQNKWIQGQISNFEYLMILNTFASRSFNDINQYPVFPWILQDYTSDYLDLDTNDESLQQKIFRDLSKPIGALNERKLNDAKEKYESWDEISEPKFHYGSHYSNAGSIINYLIRLEPFTSLNIDLQSGKFDQADRLFSSIKNAWHSCLNNRGDFRELTPEFYYFPEFLKNCNKIDFGKTQNNRDVQNVELPNWAKTPEEFILKHKEALECDYVSRHLNEWIDLIFGYKQRGPLAVTAVNIFRHVSYEGAIDLSKIEDKVEQSIVLQQIFHLGQTPTQLFTTRHPAKKVIVNNQKIPGVKKTANPVKLSGYIFHPKDPNKPVSRVIFPFDVSILIDKEFNMNLLLNESEHPIIHLSRDNEYIYIVFKNLELYSIPFQPKCLLYDSLKWSEVKHKSAIVQLGRVAFNDFNPGNQLSTLIQPNKATYLIIGGYLDNSFKILKEGIGIETVETVRFHKKLVTAIDSAYIPRVKRSYIAAGSKDYRISLWELESIISQPSSSQNKKQPSQILYGHHNEITAICIEKTLGLLVSCDKDRVVLLFCVTSGKIIKSIYLDIASDDFVKTIKVDENGFIVLLTMKSTILTYSVNGELLCKNDKYTFKKKEITTFSFIDKLKPYIIVSLKDTGDLIVIDFLTGKGIRNLSETFIWGDRSGSDLQENKVKELFKNSWPTMMFVGDEGKYMYLGYENGLIGIMGKNYQGIFETLEATKSNLTELGFEF